MVDRFFLKPIVSGEVGLSARKQLIRRRPDPACAGLQLRHFKRIATQRCVQMQKKTSKVIVISMLRLTGKPQVGLVKVHVTLDEY